MESANRFISSVLMHLGLGNGESTSGEVFVGPNEIKIDQPWPKADAR